MEDSFSLRDEHALYPGGPIGPYFVVVVGALVMRSPLPDDIGYKEKEQDAAHDCGSSYLEGSPITISAIIRVVTSLKTIQAYELQTLIT